jgi:hypothetical protein
LHHRCISHTHPRARTDAQAAGAARVTKWGKRAVALILERCHRKEHDGELHRKVTPKSLNTLSLATDRQRRGSRSSSWRHAQAARIESSSLMQAKLQDQARYVACSERPGRCGWNNSRVACWHEWWQNTPMTCAKNARIVHKRQCRCSLT